MGPLIDRLYKRYHAVALEEAQRTINKLPESATAQRAELKAEVEELARRIVNKLLHDPVQGLRASDSAHGPLPQYLHALERLFKLEGDGHSPTPPDDNGQGASRGQPEEG
jgi:glutamyl-tRNA reductase